MRPDLNQIWQAVHDAGYWPSPIQGNGFKCRCPSHGGQDDQNATFRQLSDGRIQFRCWSHHCHESKHGWQMMLDELDLTTGDVYPQHLLRPPVQQAPRATAADVARFAEAKMSEGKRLTDREQSEYRQALIRQHRGVA